MVQKRVLLKFELRQDNESTVVAVAGITELRNYGSFAKTTSRAEPANSQRPTADSSAAATCSLVVLWTSSLLSITGILDYYRGGVSENYKFFSV